MEIKINDATVMRINKELGGILTDDVINKGIDAIKTREKTRIEDLPNLTYTHIDKVVLNGEELELSSWRAIMRYMIEGEGVKDKTINFAEITGLKIIKGNKREGGYSYLEDADVSIPTSDSNQVAEVIIKLAKHFKYEGRIDYHWLKKQGLARSGETDNIVL